MEHFLVFPRDRVRPEMCSAVQRRRLGRGQAARPRSGPWVLTLARVNVAMSGDALGLCAAPVQHRGFAPHRPVTGSGETRGAGEISTLASGNTETVQTEAQSVVTCEADIISDQSCDMTVK